MTKEQLAENWVNRFMRGRVDTQRCGDLLEAYAAGWEAHEAHTSIDAVAFAEWLYENRWFYFDHSTQKWHYTFEEGTSIPKKTYEKLYIKTTAELYKLFNPFGSPHRFLCPSCGKPWDIQKHNACECGATVQKTAAPQPAGPVWVKASEDVLPSEDMTDVVIRYPYKDEINKCIGSRRMVLMLIEKGYTGIEFLDESGTPPQTFTPSQIENAFYAACNGINHHLGEKAVSIETVKKLHKEYMNTNFPNSKT